MNEREAKLALIETGLQGFCEQFLSKEAEPHMVALWEAAGKSRKLNMTRGDPNIWVAALAYAFARMNFLLDDEGPLHIERNDFFNFFKGCSRSTVTQKATRIEKALNFYHGHPVFCLPEIVDAIPRMVQLPNGMIVPEKFLVGESGDGREIEIGFLDKEESREQERRLQEQQLQEQKRDREEEKKQKRLEEFRRKREEERKTQPDLFDLGD